MRGGTRTAPDVVRPRTLGDRHDTDAQATHRRAVGRASRRPAGIGSAERSQVPYITSSSRAAARSTSARCSRAERGATRSASARRRSSRPPGRARRRRWCRGRRDRGVAVARSSRQALEHARRSASSRVLASSTLHAVTGPSPRGPPPGPTRRPTDGRHECLLDQHLPGDPRRGQGRGVRRAGRAGAAAAGGTFVVRGLPEKVYEAGEETRTVVIRFDRSSGPGRAPQPGVPGGARRARRRSGPGPADRAGRGVEREEGDAGWAQGHGQGHAGGRHRWRLAVSFALVASYFVVELVYGLGRFLALLSDAGHMAADVVTLGAALVATRIAARPDTTGRRSYGSYRAEVFASLLAVVLMLGVAVYVVVEAVGRRRLRRPRSRPGRCSSWVRLGLRRQRHRAAAAARRRRGVAQRQGRLPRGRRRHPRLGGRHRRRVAGRHHGRRGLGHRRRAGHRDLRRRARGPARPPGLRRPRPARPAGMEAEVIAADLAALDGRRGRPRRPRVDVDVGHARGHRPPRRRGGRRQPCSTRPATCCVGVTGSPTPRSRSSPRRRASATSRLVSGVGGPARRLHR